MAGWSPYPEARTPGVLFLEAFGKLTSAQPGTDAPGGEDLYSVFNARAELMGWATTVQRSSPHIPLAQIRPGLWGMNEAELTAGDGTPRIGWVQVGLDADVDPALALPAMAQCLDDALRRFGEVEMSGFQVTARYLQPADPQAASDLLSALGWFNPATGPRVAALVAFDEGLLQGRTGQDLAESLQHMHTGPFAFGSPVAPSREHAIEVPTEGPGRPTFSPANVGLPVDLPEWSASAAGWVLGMVVSTARAGGGGATDLAVRLTRLA